jgi:hypothetical protein
MIDVACVDVRARVEQQIGHDARSGEVQWCLPITATLVHAAGVFGEEPNENVLAVEMRGRARIGNRTGSDQAFRGRAGRAV